MVPLPPFLVVPTCIGGTGDRRLSRAGARIIGRSTDGPPNVRLGRTTHIPTDERRLFSGDRAA
jgi:hypothetical protein